MQVVYDLPKPLIIRKSVLGLSSPIYGVLHYIMVKYALTKYSQNCADWESNLFLSRDYLCGPME